MKKNKPESLEKARGYAFLLLKFRLRSEKEITQRLKGKKFDEQVIKETIEFLKERKFIDDQAFAKAWIESRIRKPLGLRRLRQELSLKGIDMKIIDAELEEVKKDYIEQ
ncbi:MAG: regulatory protein RecX, partial [Nitrospirota bacterium]|nr:regulatory protein RecX [Nitrospirota bacterium]